MACKYMQQIDCACMRNPHVCAPTGSCAAPVHVNPPCSRPTVYMMPGCCTSMALAAGLPMRLLLLVLLLAARSMRAQSADAGSTFALDLAAADLLKLRDDLAAAGQLDPDSPLFAWNTTGSGPCLWDGPGWDGVVCDYTTQSVTMVALSGVRGPLPHALAALTWLQVRPGPPTVRLCAAANHSSRAG